MLILGLNAFHADSSACIVRDGILLAAVEEERFRRIKHWAGFPSQAIRYCLAEAGATLSDVDAIAVNQDSRANVLEKAKYVAFKRPDLQLVLGRIRNRQARASVADLVAEAFPGETFRGRVEHVEHHFAHMSSAFHVSPFDDAFAVSVDGFGDFASTAWGRGVGSDLSIDGRVLFPHSLGVFYQAMTQFLGFPHYGDEYKVMGLAPYGSRDYVGPVSQLVKLQDDGRFKLDLSFFRHHQEEIAYQWEDGSPEFGDVFSPELEKLLGPRRAKDEPLEQKHKDIARAVQAVYEDVFFHLLRTAGAKSGSTNVAVAGGCGNNSVANGKIRRETHFRKVYVHAAPGDAGGAIGAAFAVWHREAGRPRFRMRDAYWGPSFGSDDFDRLLDSHADGLSTSSCEVRRFTGESELCRLTAQAIADGKVVGWFQGRMEWGPRALGNRSILGDPRRADMKQILNEKIKRRESFRPFAPSVLEDAVGEWFEEDDAVPFMTQVFQIREDKRPLVPAVTHADGSGRLQTVYRETNPRYASLIAAFRDITGVPMVLNTSFNENEPVVCRPEEALDCFMRSKMDVLVLGDRMVVRTDG